MAPAGDGVHAQEASAQALKIAQQETLHGRRCSYHCRAMPWLMHPFESVTAYPPHSTSASSGRAACGGHQLRTSNGAATAAAYTRRYRAARGSRHRRMEPRSCQPAVAAARIGALGETIQWVAQTTR